MLLSGALETLLGLQDAVDRAFDTGFFDSTTTSRGVHPPVNIFEKSGDLVLVAELPGVKKEDLNIEVKGNTIRLAGERIIEYNENVSYHRVERNSSKFDRTLRLPFNVESDKVKAEYKDGLLVISLSRAESDKSKQITIQ
ncbi:small heat shock molecular chaperone [Candidatus Scalindua japonica]|uniref:Small heat shock molecular chaperone n=1 Tax=Candidatus Scalindua japonica TaxID=1284222 RepID=A0A286U0I2_9BACT|nr:Hsp20/alpha crystallin family protein [Candidatus Scalindua japonica]GAX61642.1 small heat shock molecular chaperone [Candidatus Scalindua japonica]